MNLKQIETFRWIAKLGSFAAAADRMNSTQSAISIRIQELEYRLGVTLFNRDHRKTQLTPKGREILPLADNLIDVIWQIRECVNEADGVEGIVKIGVGDLVGITWLPDYIHTIREHFPNVELDIDVGLTLDLVDRLCNSELDLALVPPIAILPEFSHLPLGQVKFVWAGSKKLKIAKKALKPSDLKEFPVITLSRSSYHHHTIERWFMDGGVRCRRVITCNSIHTMLSLTNSGVGVSLVPDLSFQENLAYGDLVVLNTSPRIAPVEFSVLAMRENNTPVIQALMKIAAEVSTYEKSAQFSDSNIDADGTIEQDLKQHDSN